MLLRRHALYYPIFLVPLCRCKQSSRILKTDSQVSKTSEVHTLNRLHCCLHCFYLFNPPSSTTNVLVFRAAEAQRRDQLASTLLYDGERRRGQALDSDLTPVEAKSNSCGHR